MIDIKLKPAKIRRKSGYLEQEAGGHILTEGSGSMTTEAHGDPQIYFVDDDADADFYDIDFKNGDFELEEGFDTALLMSVFCEKRADASEIAAPENRGGWWGNLLNDVDGYEVGSKLWIKYQSKLTDDILNQINDYAKEGHKWLVEDGHATSVRVKSEIVDGVVELNIETKINDSIETTRLKLWNKTGV